MASLPTARGAVSRHFVTLAPETPLIEAISILVKKRVSGAPVVDARGQLAGVLTEKDCLRLLANVAWGEIAGGSVAQYMSAVGATVTVDMDLFVAAREFLGTNFPILPLLEEGRLVGRITRQDLLKQILVLNRELERQRKREQKRLRKVGTREARDRLDSLAGASKPEDLATLLEEHER